MADDDIDKILREVEAALGPTAASAARPVQNAPAAQNAPATGLTDRLRAGVPRATVVGAACGFVAGGLFAILPFVDGLSGALAGFGAGFVVSLSGRLRRSR